MSRKAKLLAAIREEDTSVSVLSSANKTDKKTWYRDAWENAAEYIRSNYSNSTTKGSINVLTGTITSSETNDITDNYWGIDHYKPTMRTIIKKGTTLLGHHGESVFEQSKSRYFVVTNSKIYRFEGLNRKLYFNAAYSGIDHYAAAEYFTNKSESTKASNCIDRAASAITTYYNNN